MAAGVSEIVHETITTLQGGIEEGLIEVPPLMSWNEWQSWRSQEGPQRRPLQRRDGVKRTTNQEVWLWQDTMRLNHGEDWRDQLDAREEDDEEENEEHGD